jgi:hypothetical protein
MSVLTELSEAINMSQTTYTEHIDVLAALTEKYAIQANNQPHQDPSAKS